MSKTCRWCKCEIDYPKQICIDPRSASGDCESDILYIGFRFYGIPEQRHKFYLELKAAHFIAVEIGDSVLAQTEDIVAVDEIFKRVVDHGGALVRAHAQRFSEYELQSLEDRAKAAQAELDKLVWSRSNDTHDPKSPWYDPTLKEAPLRGAKGDVHKS